MDPHRRQVRHLGADPRADRIGQGSRGADDPRAEPARHATSSRRSTARRCPTRCSSRRSSATRKGAFTGAHDRKPGRLELANNGTLFLDEIGDLSLIAQAKLLRVLEERRFERLGGNTSIEVNFRLISATNRPLDQFVRDSRFREDLYYRVNAFSIRLPSLRERDQRHSGPRAALPRALLRRQRPAARRQVVLEGSDRPADAVSLAGQHPRARKHGRRARRCRRRAASSAPADIEFLHAQRNAGRGRARAAAVAGRRRARPHRARARERATGTRSRRPACSKSAAARCTGRSSSTAWKSEPRPSRNRPRRPGRE